MSIILQPQQPKLDARQLPELIALWLEDCRTRLPRMTVRGYAFKMQWFLDWWGEVGPQCAYILHKSDLVSFARWLAVAVGKDGRPLSFNTRKDVFRRLRQMFRWALLNGYTDGKDYGAWLPKVDGGTPLRQAPNLEQLRRLLDATSRTPHPARNYALLAFLIGTGVRREEAANLRIEHITFYADGTGVAIITGKRTAANPTGQRYVALDAPTASAITAYIASVPVTSGPLFCGLHCTPLTGHHIGRIVKLCAKLAGLSAQIVSTHDLRRAFATRAQIPAAMVSKQLGHRNSTMTDHYRRLDIDDVRTALVSPMALIS